jgi:hypothetical protein
MEDTLPAPSSLRPSGDGDGASGGLLSGDLLELDEDVEGTWRTVPDATPDPPRPSDSEASSTFTRTSRAQSTIQHLLPTIVLTSSSSPSTDSPSQSYELTLTRGYLTALLSPLLVQIRGVVSTAIDIFLIKQSRLQQQSQSQQQWEREGEVLVDIDEVVLVGGSSLIPAIQQTVRDLLRDKHIPSFSPRPPPPPLPLSHPSTPPATALTTEPGRAVAVEKEFCSSISPYECVVNGLAVKGALLAGVDSSLLQDILMIDATPSAIGILIWVPSSAQPSTGGSSLSYLQPHGRGHGESREAASSELVSFFEPLIARGTSLPCKVKKSFEIDERCLVAGLLTLQLFEEVYSSSASTSSSLTQTEGEVSTEVCEEERAEGGDGRVLERGGGGGGGSSLHELGSYELPILDCVYRHRGMSLSGSEITGDESEGAGPCWLIDLELSMDAEGILSYAICPPPAGTGAEGETTVVLLKKSAGGGLVDEEGASKASITLLGVYIFFLFLLYLFVKILLSPPPLSASSSPLHLEEELETLQGGRVDHPDDEFS